MKIFFILKSKILFYYRILKYRRSILKDARRIGPWYQPIKISNLINIKAIDKDGKKYGNYSLDRGIRKWNKFIKPHLPFSLKDKRILELGCNAGLFLFNSIINHNAKSCVGIDYSKQYLKQADFLLKNFEKIYNKKFPITFYFSKMEEFPYEKFDNFDVCFFLQSIYHIGGKKYDISHTKTLELQTQLLKKLSKKAKYFIFLGNSIEDEGRGKGIESLNYIIKKSGLKKIKEVKNNHPRGYLVVCSAKTDFQEKININNAINKLFKKITKSSEYEFLQKLLKNKNNLYNTSYYHLRSGKVDWNFPGVSKFPKKLDIKKRKYWVIPWAFKNRSVDTKEENYLKYKGNFLKLYDYFKKKKINKEAIEGYYLIHPKKGYRFLYTDGNHRMAIFKYLNKKKGYYKNINVSIINKIHRKDLLKNPLTIKLIKQKFFSKKDAFKWFDNAFY